MVRAIASAAMAIWCAVIWTGCGQVFIHDPDKARETADNFFAYLYKLKDYEKAYSMTGKSFIDDFKEGYLEKLQGDLENKYGRFQGIRPDSYFYDGGSRDIEVFYTVIYNNGITYQKITLSDDGRGGYRVSSIVCDDRPFTGYRLMKKFRE